VVLVSVLGIGWLFWPHADGGAVRAARATVVQAVLCGPSGGKDLVSVELPGGRLAPAWLDGCGHRPGEVLDVEVPDPFPAGDVTARLAGTGVSAAAAGGQRVGAVGVGIAGTAGAFLAWRLRGAWSGARRRVGP
jgi:hypothetical protein